MKIVVDVDDAQCSDAGMYYCDIMYYYGSNEHPPLSSGQNLTVSGEYTGLVFMQQQTYLFFTAIYDIYLEGIGELLFLN